MAIVDYLADSLAFAGSWPGTAADPAYALKLLKMTYRDDALLQMQQLESVLSGACRPETIEGYEKRISRYNAVTLAQRARGAFLGDDVTGGAATQETGITTVVLRGQPWEFAEPFDPRDKVGLTNLWQSIWTGQYAANIAGGLGRKLDEIIVTEMIGSAQQGDGGGALTFAADGGLEADKTLTRAGTSNPTTGTPVTQFNVSKLISMRNLLDRNDATRMGDLHVAIHADQVASLLRDDTSTPGPRAISGDFNSLKPLMAGEITKFMGATFHLCNVVPVIADVDTTAGGTQIGHRTYMWNSNAMVCGKGNYEAWIDASVGRAKTIIVYTGIFLGAVRTDGKGVTFVQNADSSTVAA